MLREVGTNNLYPLKVPGQTIIGRGKKCDIQPESTSISKQHAIISTEKDTKNQIKYWIEDLESRNGTSTSSSNGVWNIIQPKNRYPLRFGDLLKFGHSATTYILEEKENDENEDDDDHGVGKGNKSGIGQTQGQDDNKDKDRDKDDTTEFGYEREPLNYKPEVLSTSMQVDKSKLSKEQEPIKTPKTNKLQFSIEYPTDQIEDYPPISVQVGQSRNSGDFSGPTTSSKNKSLRQSRSLEQQQQQQQQQRHLDRSVDVRNSHSSSKKSERNKREDELYVSDDDESGKGVEKRELNSSPLDGEGFEHEHEDDIDGDGDGDDDENEYYFPDYHDSEQDGDSDFEKQGPLFYDSDSLAVMGVGFNRPPSRKRNPDKNHLGSSLPHAKDSHSQKNSRIHPLRSSSPSNLHYKYDPHKGDKSMEVLSQPIPSMTTAGATSALISSSSASPSSRTKTSTRSVGTIEPLSNQEITEIQASRDELADGVRVANKILGGVAPLDEWKKYASTILTRLSPSLVEGGVGGGHENDSDLNPLTRSTPMESKFKILVTTEVISAVKREKVMEISQTSVSLLTKVKNNLIFLLEYENNSQSFPCDLFNNVLTNSIQLFHDKILSNQLIVALDRSVQSSLQSSPSLSKTSHSSSPLSIIKYMTTTILPKFQGLITFNENWNSQTSHLTSNSSYSSFPTKISLDLNQILQVNRHISSTLVDDIEQLLDCILQLKNNILKENIQLSKYIFHSSNPEEEVNPRNSQQNPQLHQQQHQYPHSRSHNHSNHLQQPQQQLFQPRQPVDTSLEGMLSGEFTSDGELRIQSTPVHSTNQKKQGNIRISPRQTEEYLEVDDDLRQSQSPPPQQQSQPQPGGAGGGGAGGGGGGAKKIAKSQSIEHAVGEKTDAKPLWNTLIKEVKKQTSLPQTTTAAGMTSSQPSSPRSQQFPLWPRNNEFESKSKSISIIKRVHKRLCLKSRNIFFYHWRQVVNNEKEEEYFESKWKLYQSTHLQEIEQHEMTLRGHYKELLELKEREIQALHDTMEEKSNISEDEIVRRSAAYLLNERLIQEKEMRISELEKENQVMLDEKKIEIETEYTKQLERLDEKNQQLEREGKLTKLESQKKISLMKCESSNQKRRAYNLKFSFETWKLYFQKEKEKIYKKKLKDRQLYRLLRLLDSNTTRRSLMKAFYFWNKYFHVTQQKDSLLTSFTSNQQTITSLRSQLLHLKEDLQSQAQSNPLLLQLHAERVLNRELISINLDLQNKLINLENKLLEIIQIPLTQRKQLVCDVLIERENEIVKFRRENRSLKEQITRLKEILQELHERKNKKRRDNRGNSDGEEQLEQEQGGEGKRKEGWGRRQEEEQEEEEEEDEEENGVGEEEEMRFQRHSPHHHHHHPRNQHKDHDYDLPPTRHHHHHQHHQHHHANHRNHNHRKNHHLPRQDHSNPTQELNKKDAMKIIIRELRALQSQNNDLKYDTKTLAKQLFDETTRFQQQTLALQVLQQGSINLEKKYQQFIQILIKKYDEREIYEIIDVVENN